MASNQCIIFIFKMLLWDTWPYFTLGSIICSKRNNFRTWFFKVNSSKCNVFNDSLSTWNGNQSDTLSSKRAGKKYIIFNLYSLHAFLVSSVTSSKHYFFKLMRIYEGKILEFKQPRSAQCAQQDARIRFWMCE